MHHRLLLAACFLGIFLVPRGVSLSPFFLLLDLLCPAFLVFVFGTSARAKGNFCRAGHQVHCPLALVLAFVRRFCL
jgi:hypothetical protein